MSRPAVPATALIVDLRDFTLTFSDATARNDEQAFLAVLANFYEVCLAAAGEACSEPSGTRLHVNSTGDGMLLVFLGGPGEPPGTHALRAYLTAVLLQQRLPPVFAALQKKPTTSDPRFGMGLESGEVHIVDAAAGDQGVRTCIGHCINIAARLEDLTKTVSATALVVGEEANAHVTEALLPGVRYADLVRQARNPALDSATLAAVFGEMRRANDAIGLTWIGAVNLKGVDQPLLAFRSAVSILQRRHRDIVAALRSALPL